MGPQCFLYSERRFSDSERSKLMLERILNKIQYLTTGKIVFYKKPKNVSLNRRQLTKHNKVTQQVFPNQSQYLSKIDFTCS